MSRPDPGSSGQHLRGGVANVGAVIRRGDVIQRPSTRHSEAIHELLHHLRADGFDGAPRPLELNGAHERLEYIPGEVPVPPFPPWWKTDQTLASTAELLRRFHDATEALELADRSRWSTELADPHGHEVICHNDVCPENVVYRAGIAVALLDFDYAAPGRRVYDLATCAKMCCPLDAPRNAERIGLDDVNPFARLRVIVDAYGLRFDPRDFLDAVFDSVRIGERFVRQHVARGDPGFTAMWLQRGGEQRARERARWLRANRARLVEALG
jgi:hypothetical protein